MADEDKPPLNHGQLEGKIHRKHFLDYFVDACFFASDSTETKIENQTDQEKQKRFIRSSILNSALCLEAAANCCLDFLRLQKPSHDDYEQLKTLAKFELFLHYIRPQGTLDRENKLVRPIRNVLSCRNEYVHSKVVVDKMDANRHVSKIWEPIGLPHNSGFWHPLHAVKVFTVVSDFLNHFFFEACGIPYEGHEGRGFVSNILMSGISSNDDRPLPGGVKYSSLQNNSVLMTTFIAAKWDLDFAYLGMYSTGVGNAQNFPKRRLGEYTHCDLNTVATPPQFVVYRTPEGFSFGILSVDKHPTLAAQAKSSPDSHP